MSALARKTMLGAALVLAASTPLSAQDQCADSNTVRECAESTRLAAAAAPGTNIKTTTVNTAKALTAGKPAGESDASGLAPTIDDFLPRLAAAALAPGLDTGIVARITGNFSLNSEHFSYTPLALRFGAELRRPEVYGAMLDSVAEARRAAVRDRLGKTLGEFDHPELTFAMNWETRRLGRRLDPHLDELHDIGAGNPAIDLVARATGELDLLLDPANLTGAAGCTAGEHQNDLEGTKLGCFEPGTRESIRSLARRLGSAARAFETDFATWAESSGWKYIADLLNNQPQVSAHFDWVPRAHAVGPETWAGRLRYERGWTNLNAVRNHCQRVEKRSPGTGYSSKDGINRSCFADYVGAHRGDFRLGLRGFVEGEVRRSRRFEAPFEESDSAGFAEPGAWRLGLTGGVGGYLPTRATIQGSRIDLAFSGEWGREDDLRPSRRATVSLGLTQRLNQNFSLLSGLVWSDRGEFKDEDVHPVRLRLGVRYKLVPSIPGQ